MKAPTLEEHFRRKETQRIIKAVGTIRRMYAETCDENISIAAYEERISDPGFSLKYDYKAYLTLLGCEDTDGFFNIRHLLESNVMKAMDKTTAPEVLAELAADSNDLVVLYAVSRNVGTPPEALSDLVTSEDIQVRQGVALNRSTPQEALQALVDADEEGTGWFVAQNYNTSETLLLALCESYSSVIAVRTQFKTVITHITRMEKAEVAKIHLLNRDDIPVHLIEELMSDPEMEIAEAAREKRLSIAVKEHPEVPPEWLEASF